MKEMLIFAVFIFFSGYGVYQFTKSTFKNIISVIAKIRERKE